MRVQMIRDNDQPDIISTLTGTHTEMTHYDGLNKPELIRI